jgi:serine phosphatase RsbU (regulator of sigma subunit)
MARLDVSTGLLQWVNAGHPAPLLLRGHTVVAALESPTTLPVGFGGAQPVVTDRQREPGDRVLFFTDGLIERAGLDGGPVQGTVRRLSHSLMLERGGITSDDATLLLLEWRGGTVDHLAVEHQPS